MKKKKIILIVLLIILISLLGFLFLDKKILKDDNQKNKNEIISTEEKKELIEEIVEDINGDANNSTSDNEKYDQYLVASGYSGASDNVYYIKDGVLYHLVISTGEITKIAEGVLKIEADKGGITVYKGDNFKIFESEDYLSYVD